MKKYFAILFLLALAIFISGCISILPTLEEESITPGKGRLKIYLTDSSGDYKASDDENYLAVNITISEIKVHLAGEDEEAEGEWIEWVLFEPTEDNLIELKDVFVLLSEGELTSGKYTQIRLFITNPNILLNEGEEYITLIIPSAYQTGIKLIHPFEINDGQTTELTIDFDAEKSIIKTGDGNYKLNPVIKILTGFTDEAEEVVEE
jgi:hypothetical protein